ncbi:hypothetical protein ABPG72_018392 [Tetrahymena utriculariae]
MGQSLEKQSVSEQYYLDIVNHFYQMTQQDMYISSRNIPDQVQEKYEYEQHNLDHYGAQGLASSLKKCKKLKNLTLSLEQENVIDEQAAEQIGKSMKGLKNLEQIKLIFQRNYIVESRIIDLLSFNLSFFSSLVIFDIGFSGNNQANTKIFQVLSKLIAKLQQLKGHSIYIDHNQQQNFLGFDDYFRSISTLQEIESFRFNCNLQMNSYQWYDDIEYCFARPQLKLKEFQIKVADTLPKDIFQKVCSCFQQCQFLEKLVFDLSFLCQSSNNNENISQNDKLNQTLRYLGRCINASKNTLIKLNINLINFCSMVSWENLICLIEEIQQSQKIQELQILFPFTYHHFKTESKAKFFQKVSKFKNLNYLIIKTRPQQSYQSIGMLNPIFKIKKLVYYQIK